MPAPAGALVDDRKTPNGFPGSPSMRLKTQSVPSRVLSSSRASFLPSPESTKKGTAPRSFERTASPTPRRRVISPTSNFAARSSFSRRSRRSASRAAAPAMSISSVTSRRERGSVPKSISKANGSGSSCPRNLVHTKARRMFSRCFRREAREAHDPASAGGNSSHQDLSPVGVHPVMSRTSKTKSARSSTTPDPREC